MNERIRRLMEQAVVSIDGQTFGKTYIPDAFTEKFAELIVEECRTVVTEVYRNTSLELCGPLLAADEEIAKHFYGVEE